MQNLNLTEILRKVAEDHDMEAFRILVERHSNQLYTYAQVFIRNEELAEEIVSDVWLKIWNQKERLPEIKSFSAYLFTATKNQALTYRTRIDNNPTLGGDQARVKELSEYTEKFTPQNAMEKAELNDFLDTEISQLPVVCQTAFRLVKEEGMSYQEAASEMKISVNTLKTHLRRAVKKLRSGIRERISDFISTSH